MNGRAWTKEEYSYLREHYTNFPLTKMASDLQRSISAIKTTAQRKLHLSRKHFVPDRYCQDCGKNLYKYGGVQSERCIHCSNKHRSGEKHANWKGGISTLTDIIRRNLFETWVFPILQRDDFTCQLCGKYRDIHVHHLRPLKVITDEVFQDNPHLSFENARDRHVIAHEVVARHQPNDGISLCPKCHIMFHSEKSGELLGTPNASGEGNQQPSQSKVVSLVDWKVQRLMGEETTTNKPNTSARHSVCPTG